MQPSLSGKSRLIAVFFICAAFGAQAAGPVTFTALVDGESRAAVVTPISVQDTPYLPLVELARQLGGGVRLAPARIQVDLAGKSAVAAVNDSAVEASASRFFLRHPVIRQDGNVMIALEDIEVFFWRAFQVSLRMPEAPAETPVAPRESEELEAARILTEWSPAPPPSEELPPAPPPIPPEIAPPAAPPASADPALHVATPSLEAASEALMRLDAAPPAPPPAPHAGTVDTIVVDAGHGGNDIGSGGQGGLLEKDLTLALALALRQALKEKSDLRIVLIRSEDRDMPMKERVNIANQQRNALLVSLHGGASFAPQANGIAVFCALPQSSGGETGDRARAEMRRDHAATGRHYAAHVAGALAETTQAAARGVHEAPLQLQRDLNMPVVLIEAGFLSNPAEEALLATPAYQQSLAEGIATGIIRARDAMRAGRANP